jgi:hypothetical protein
MACSLNDRVGNVPKYMGIHIQCLSEILVSIFRIMLVQHALSWAHYLYPEAERLPGPRIEK